MILLSDIAFAAAVIAGWVKSREEAAELQQAVAELREDVGGLREDVGGLLATTEAAIARLPRSRSKRGEVSP